MPYPERKPIYDTYKVIIDDIIAEKKYKSYADAEIDDLDRSLLAAFREIRLAHSLQKEWLPEE